MHVMFINTMEEYGFEKHERPNWINVVRQPIERLVSLYYVTCQKENVSIYKIQYLSEYNFTDECPYPEASFSYLILSM